MIKEGDSINNELLEFIKECIKNNNMHSFYIKKVWREKRKEIIKRDHYECQACKRKGKIKVLKIICLFSVFLKHIYKSLGCLIYFGFFVNKSFVSAFFCCLIISDCFFKINFVRMNELDR